MVVVRRRTLRGYHLLAEVNAMLGRNQQQDAAADLFTAAGGRGSYSQIPRIQRSKKRKASGSAKPILGFRLFQYVRIVRRTFCGLRCESQKGRESKQPSNSNSRRLQCSVKGTHILPPIYRPTANETAWRGCYIRVLPQSRRVSSICDSPVSLLPMVTDGHGLVGFVLDLHPRDGRPLGRRQLHPNLALWLLK